jgi:hypothetical protein
VLGHKLLPQLVNGQQAQRVGWRRGQARLLGFKQVAQATGALVGYFQEPAGVEQRPICAAVGRVLPWGLLALFPGVQCTQGLHAL